jgi:hypothetical protein
MRLEAPTFTSERKYMATIRRASHQIWASVDGSGKFNQQRFLCQAGYLGHADQLEAFQAAWVVALERHGIGWLSMKDAMALEGPFRAKKQEWGKDVEVERMALLFDFADVIRAHELSVFAFGVDAHGFKDKQVEPSELYLFVKVLELLTPMLPPEATLMIIADEEENLGPKLYEFFRKMRLNPETRELTSRVKLLGIADDQAFPSLQAADMLAYAMVQELQSRRDVRGEPDELFKRLSQKATYRNALKGELWDPTAFLKAAHLV